MRHFPSIIVIRRQAYMEILKSASLNLVKMREPQV